MVTGRGPPSSSPWCWSRTPRAGTGRLHGARRGWASSHVSWNRVALGSGLEVSLPASGPHEASDRDGSHTSQKPAAFPPTHSGNAPRFKPRGHFLGQSDLKRKASCGVKSGPHPPPWTRAWRACRRGWCAAISRAFCRKQARSLCVLNLVFEKRARVCARTDTHTHTKQAPAGLGLRSAGRGLDSGCVPTRWPRARDPPVLLSRFVVWSCFSKDGGGGAPAERPELALPAPCGQFTHRFMQPARPYPAWRLGGWQREGRGQLLWAGSRVVSGL